MILGDDDAKNSIGKSSALLVIDFAMGGTSLLDDKAGTIKALGHHFYKFEFIFEGKKYFFIRYTNDSNFAHICDKDYQEEDVITIREYREKLKQLYELGDLKCSFRFLVNPFIRIWNKGSLEPAAPFLGDVKESTDTAISRLIDLFEKTGDIEEERSVLDEHKKKKGLISKSMSAEIIPKINKIQYKENQRTIAGNMEVIETLKQGVTGALSAYESLFDEELRALQTQKNDLVRQRSQVQAKIGRIRLDILGVTPRLTANIALVQEFFPNVDAGRLQQVESFHQNISKTVQKELKKDLQSHSDRETELSAKISELDSRIQAKLESKGAPNDLFSRVLELKTVVDNAAEENRFYDMRVAIDSDVLQAKQRLEAIYTGIFLHIESELNARLKKFNAVVYGRERNASQLRIKSSNSYSFLSPEDTGTGKSYAGLVGFDLAMLSLTKLPFIVHDSVLYKNIEVRATEKILRILAWARQKQIFLAFDEATKFDVSTEKRLRSHTVLKLSANDLLYNKDWR